MPDSFKEALQKALNAIQEAQDHLDPDEEAHLPVFANLEHTSDLIHKVMKSKITEKKK